MARFLHLAVVYSVTLWRLAKTAADSLLAAISERMAGVMRAFLHSEISMALNRPGFELTPRSWTNFKGFYEEVTNRVQA